MWLYPPSKIEDGHEQTKHLEDVIFSGGLKPIILIGRCTGIISRSDVLKNVEAPRTVTVASVITGSLSVFYFFNAILLTRTTFLGNHEKRSLADKLWDFQFPGYNFSMFFVYAYLLFATRRFRTIAQNFMSSPSKIQLPKRFRRFCWIVTIIWLILALVENVFCDILVLQKASSEMRKSNTSVLEFYYRTNYAHWKSLIQYHPTITLFNVVLLKCGTFGWLHCDVLVVVLTRAVVEKFRCLNSAMEIIITNRFRKNSLLETMEPTTAVELKWVVIHDEFLLLRKLTQEVQRLIAPLIMACYGINIYIIVISLYNWIAPNSAATLTLEQLLHVYAFIQFLFRVLSLTYFASEVHHANRNILGTIHQCPNTLYSQSVSINKTIRRIR
ncbi:unnamed protein product [Orchesella dallaii]|uniref:Gustatory receptor n=1 Tax=Orchesella dallaii TaxID=48710 RepID=A0ABP1S7P8_9HEXA